ncbi:MAG: hypothetical protein VXA26_12485 [Candidatus Neomarinimicrobiota bacterium]
MILTESASTASGNGASINFSTLDLDFFWLFERWENEIADANIDIINKICL